MPETYKSLDIRLRTESAHRFVYEIYQQSTRLRTSLRAYVRPEDALAAARAFIDEADRRFGPETQPEG
ncbi:MAG: hypothetical protein AAGF99_07145 [Bacteroidota bacterium]